MALKGLEKPGVCADLHRPGQCVAQPFFDQRRKRGRHDEEARLELLRQVTNHGQDQRQALHLVGVDLIENEGGAVIVAQHGLITAQPIESFQHLVGAEDAHRLLVQLGQVEHPTRLGRGLLWFVGTLHQQTIEREQTTAMLQSHLISAKNRAQPELHGVHAGLVRQRVEQARQAVVGLSLPRRP